MKLRDLRQTQQDAYIQEMSELFMAYGQYKTMLSEGQLDEAGAWEKVKSAFGKGMSGVKTANDAINKLGSLAQSTGPVQGFDAKSDALINKIGDANPKIKELATKYSEWAKKNPVKQGLIIGMLTAVSTLVAGPAGGAAAGYVLRAGNELLKGEKMSTALGKGLKSAAVGGALGWLAGVSIDSIKDAFKEAQPILKQLPVENMTKLFRDVKVNGRTILYINQVFPNDVAEKISKLGNEAWKSMNDNPDRAAKLYAQIDQLVNDSKIKQQVVDTLARNDAIMMQNKELQSIYDAAKAAVDTKNTSIENFANTIKTATQGVIQGAAASGLADKAAAKAVNAGSKVGTGAAPAKPAPKAAPAAQPAAATPDKRADLKAKQQAWQAQQRRMGKLK